MDEPLGLVDELFALVNEQFPLVEDPHAWENDSEPVVEERKMPGND